MEVNVSLIVVSIPMLKPFVRNRISPRKPSYIQDHLVVDPSQEKTPVVHFIQGIAQYHLDMIPLNQIGK